MTQSLLLDNPLQCARAVRKNEQWVTTFLSVARSGVAAGTPEVWVPVAGSDRRLETKLGRGSSAPTRLIEGLAR